MSKLPEMVQALLDPKAYPETPQQIELGQTQMSFVFMTENYVYKVKKPVNLGYLDYTTLDKRQFFCQREVELNRRLCPDVYLGIVTITRNEGDIVVNGKGKIIEEYMLEYIDGVECWHSRNNAKTTVYYIKSPRSTV